MTLPRDQGQHCISDTATPCSQRRRRETKKHTVLAEISMLFYSSPDCARHFLDVKYSVFAFNNFHRVITKHHCSTYSGRSENISLWLKTRESACPGCVRAVGLQPGPWPASLPTVSWRPKRTFEFTIHQCPD